MADIEQTRTENETSTEVEERSRLRGYDKRLEEWLGSLKDEAGQRSPEVLSALAAKAKDVSEYLEKMAEQARSRRVPDEVRPTSQIEATSPNDEPLDSGAALS